MPQPPFLPQTPSGQYASERLHIRYTGYLVGSSVIGVGVLTAAIFFHDAFTYSERHIVLVSPRALHPERGRGPTNLPVLSRLLSDLKDDRESRAIQQPHLVIVGGG
ncbi:hypothetical protein OH77DRAFT_1432334 [Trametes cingulata]|nr:hypothetical protein OH77DRAFT_1432334 [Trametes cingulata]